MDCFDGGPSAESGIEKNLEESHQGLKKSLDESQKRIEKNLSNLSRHVGGLSNSVGELTESMFSGKLRKQFAQYGITVWSQSVRRTFTEGDRIIAEADIFIENGDYAIPVEIKTKLTKQSVNEHIKRIGRMRQNLDSKGDKRKLIGAVAGGVIPDNVLKYAQEKGFFVLTQSGDNVVIADTPSGFKPREW